MNRNTTMTASLLRSKALFASVLLVVAAAPLAAQNASRPGDREFRWSGQAGAGTLIRVTNIAGDVIVTTAEGSRVELVATRRGSSSDSDARVEVNQHANGITICALHGEGSTCEPAGPDNDGRRRSRRDHEDRAYYDFEIRVPRNMRLAAGSVSGDVTVRGTAAELRASSVSGDVRVEGARATGELAATSVSGDVVARLDAVAERTDLEFKSVSGDVTVTMPRTTGFDLSMSTVSGDLESDFPIQMQGRFSRRRIQAQVNQGGSDVHVSTVSGDVRLAHNPSN